MKLSRRNVAAIGAAAMLVLPAFAGAQQVLVSGSATGCFNCTTGATTSTFNGATYYGSNFSDYTSGTTPNRVSFGGNPVAAYPGNLQNFGSVSLSNTPGASFNGSFFDLFLTFTSPANANQTFTALLTGQVVTNPSNTSGGSLHFAFSPDQSFVFGNGSTATVHVNDLDVNPGNLASVTGNVTVTTPEPSSMALLGTGLIGLVPMFRRKKQA